MTFPEEILPLLVELHIDGVWTDITGDVRGGQAIRITRGRADESGQVSPGRCNLTLNNRDGRYSPRNPRSPHYGLIGRNTPIRVSVHRGDPYLHLPGALGDHASTPDTAALDITGDIDVRFDGAVANLLGAGDVLRTTELIAKLGFASGSKSWMLAVREGRLYLEWSADGIDTLGVKSTTAPLPGPAGRLAVRATLDVDNGAGGHTVTFYTAGTMAGPWTQLGDAVTATGTTSVYSGTMPLRIGDSSDVGMTVPIGRCYAAQVCDGIGGTIVADPDFTAQTIGATSFVDSAGRTWTLAGGTEITDRQVRFCGEVSSWPAQWTEGGRDVWTPIDASGLLRRMGQGSKALDSTLRRRIPSGNPVAYWPMEEGDDATRMYSPIAGVQPLEVTGLNFAADNTLAGSSALPSWDEDARVLASVPDAPPGEWQVECVYRLDTLESGLNTLLEVHTTGIFAHYTIRAQTNNIRVEAHDQEGVELTIINVTAPEFTAQWNRLHLRAVPDGSGTEIELRWTTIGGGGLASTYTHPRSAGRVSSLTVLGIPGQLRLGHLAVFSTAALIYTGADAGFNGDTAWERITRLTSEENIPITMAGTPDDSTPMGPQRPATVLSLLQEAADADHGILSEHRDTLALRYLPRSARYRRPPALTLAYGDPGMVLPLEPVDDDQNLRNDVTVTRQGGSSARLEQTTGPLSVQAPPDGVGQYDTTVTLSLAEDEQARDNAGWLLHLGTWDEARYPRVNLNLAAGPELIDAAAALEVGDRITITDPPAWLPPGPIDLIVEGYTETLAQYQWDVHLNCSPAGPWTSVRLADEDEARVDTDGSELVEASDETDTTLEVHTPPLTATARLTPWITSAGPGTTYPGEFPFALDVGGEEVTVTACEPDVWDTFTRTVANTWGTSTSGHAWSEVGGATTDRSVDGTSGVITLTASPSALRFQYPEQSYGDCEVLVSVTPSQLATGQAFLPAILLRINVGYYRCRLRLNTDGTVGMDLTNETVAVGSPVTTAVTYSAGTKLWLRARIIGQRVLGRVWRDDRPEPLTWRLDQTVTADTIDTGGVGVSASAFGGNTNVNPAFAFDGFQVVTPQTVTVTRSVNGITKAHTVGTVVRLAHPTYPAL